ncbi:MAG: flavin reductase [Xanthobacteraceae bacterium]|nr:flavin reductase [Xanthobacteraceae bacterium]
MNKPVSCSDFLRGMRRFASSVCVVASMDSGKPHGATVTSLASVSVEPPTLLVCLNHKGRCAGAIRATGRFCVNLLDERAVHVAELFSGKSPDCNAVRFDRVDWRPGDTGCPILVESLSAFECEVEHMLRVNTHWVFLGTVVASSVGVGQPLIYGDRAFRTLAKN